MFLPEEGNKIVPVILFAVTLLLAGLLSVAALLPNALSSLNAALNGQKERSKAIYRLGRSSARKPLSAALPGGQTQDAAGGQTSAVPDGKPPAANTRMGDMKNRDSKR